jgi:PAS domain S-box-containing protein
MPTKKGASSLKFALVFAAAVSLALFSFLFVFLYYRGTYVPGWMVLFFAAGLAFPALVLYILTLKQGIRSGEREEPKAAEITLMKRLQHQEFMSAISQSFISAENMATLLRNALMMTGIFMRVSKTALARLNRETNTLVFEYEWYDEKYRNLREANRSYAFGPGEIVYETFIIRGDVLLVCNSPEERPEMAAILKKRGIKSCVYAPVYIYGSFWGLLIIDRHDAALPWDESDLQLVKLIANSIAGLIIRNDTEEQLIRMSSIVNSSPQFISYITPQGQFKYMNQGVKAISGYSSEELDRRGIGFLFDEESRRKFFGEFIPAVLEQDARQWELPLIRKDGETRILTLSAFTTDSKKNGIGLIASDITEQRQLEQDLIRAKEQAEQSSLAKSNFLSRMSHEMRTPMNAIIGMTTIAQSSQDQERKEYCLAKINEASIHLLGVINDILDMSKIEAGKFELSYSEFDFEKMLRRITGVMNFRVNEKKQNLVLRLDRDMPGLIITDEQCLAQVITNLLSNAIKFTPEEGTITLSVTKVSVRDSLHTLRITVADTGIGITEEQKSRLFTLFEQADGTMARKYGGTGLGLAISKSMVELMGGDIWIESVPGKGAAFTFEITVEEGKSSRREIWDEEADQEKTALPGEEDSPVSPDPEKDRGAYAGLSILLAEDVEINREIVISLLEDTGLTIDCVENGAEAVQLFERDPAKYGMIFMDIHMPEMDGFEAARRIRTLDVPEAKTVPIVAMTANVFKEDVEKCFAAGMNDHLGKPVDFAELMKRIEKYLPVKTPQLS